MCVKDIGKYRNSPELFDFTVAALRISLTEMLNPDNLPKIVCNRRRPECDPGGGSASDMSSTGGARTVK
jgi:hypothetical protein